MSGAWERLARSLPEAERPVADREVQGDLEPTLLDINEELTTVNRMWLSRRADDKRRSSARTGGFISWASSTISTGRDSEASPDWNT